MVLATSVGRDESIVKREDSPAPGPNVGTRRISSPASIFGLQFSVLLGIRSTRSESIAIGYPRGSSRAGIIQLTDGVLPGGDLWGRNGADRPHESYGDVERLPNAFP